MPQMAPLSWLTLFIYFVVVFLMFNTLNYFSFFYTVKTSEVFKKSLKFNWKW